jgi:hypothetical protein
VIAEIESEYARLVGAKRFEGAAQTLDELLRRLTTTEEQAWRVSYLSPTERSAASWSRQ